MRARRALIRSAWNTVPNQRQLSHHGRIRRHRRAHGERHGIGRFYRRSAPRDLRRHNRKRHSTPRRRHDIYTLCRRPRRHLHISLQRRSLESKIRQHYIHARPRYGRRGTRRRGNDTNGFNVTIGQQLLAGSASGGLTKIGSGVLTLTAAPTYTGNTLISAGQLQFSTGSPTLAAISGQGELIVGSIGTPTQLTASSITLGTLTVAAGSTVTISPIAGGPLAALSSPTAVPEPGVWLMLLLAVAIFCLKKSSKPN